MATKSDTLERLLKMSEIKFPSFVHEYYDIEEEKHTFNGSIRRHVAVERAISQVSRILNFIGDAFPLYDYLSILPIIALGLNCNFPVKDVALYVVWYLKGCPT